MVLSIPEMHKHLESLNHFFTEKTTTFITIIGSHPGQLTTKDAKEFSELIQEIQNDALLKIKNFFSQMHLTKAELYESQITNYSESGQDVFEQLLKFREDLQQSTIQMKKEQNRRQNLLESFSKKYSQHIILKKAWKIFQQNRIERQRAKELDRKMDAVYVKNLMKKAFFPWRTLTYKQGYENTVRRETERDIQNIHEQYQSIIDIMKSKISETDEMIKIKRAAKGQFAFALSKNLLKTISNLSLEVMSLNQMSLRDGEADENETKRFMKTVDVIITEKLSKVREYKKSLLGEYQNEQGEEKVKRKKKITFI